MIEVPSFLLILLSIAGYIAGYFIGSYFAKEKFQKEAIAHDKAYYFNGYTTPEFRWKD